MQSLPEDGLSFSICAAVILKEIQAIPHIFRNDITCLCFWVTSQSPPWRPTFQKVAWLTYTICFYCWAYKWTRWVFSSGNCLCNFLKICCIIFLCWQKKFKCGCAAPEHPEPWRSCISGGNNFLSAPLNLTQWIIVFCWLGSGEQPQELGERRSGLFLDPFHLLLHLGDNCIRSKSLVHDLCCDRGRKHRDVVMLLLSSMNCLSQSWTF